MYYCCIIHHIGHAAAELAASDDVPVAADVLVLQSILMLPPFQLVHAASDSRVFRVPSTFIIAPSFVRQV